MNLKDNTVRKFHQPSYNFSENPTITHDARQYLFAATDTAEANTKNLPQPSTAQPPVPANGQTKPLALPPPTRGHAPGVGLRRGGAGAGATQLPNNIASRAPGNADNTVHKSDVIEMVQGPDGVYRDPNDTSGAPNNVKPNGEVGGQQNPPNSDQGKPPANGQPQGNNPPNGDQGNNPPAMNEKDQATADKYQADLEAAAKKLGVDPKTGKPLPQAQNNGQPPQLSTGQMKAMMPMMQMMMPMMYPMMMGGMMPMMGMQGGMMNGMMGQQGGNDAQGQGVGEQGPMPSVKEQMDYERDQRNALRAQVRKDKWDARFGKVKDWLNEAKFKILHPFQAHQEKMANQAARNAALQNQQASNAAQNQ